MWLLRVHAIWEAGRSRDEGRFRLKRNRRNPTPNEPPESDAIGRLPRTSKEAIVNAVTKANMETIGSAGFTVQLYGQDGRNVVEAVNEETDETFVVRGDDLYAVVVELA